MLCPTAGAAPCAFQSVVLERESVSHQRRTSGGSGSGATRVVGALASFSRKASGSGDVRETRASWPSSLPVDMSDIGNQLVTFGFLRESKPL